MIKNEGKILSTNDLSIGYIQGKQERKILFQNLNLHLKKGRLTALIGHNGVGKSTLLKTIVNLNPVLEGNIELKGKNIQHFTRMELARYISFVSTETIRFNNLSVFELAALGRFPYLNWIGKLNERDEEVTRNSLHSMGITHLEKKLVGALSDGEKQKAMIARCLAQETEIIVMDEPTAFLDMASKFEMMVNLHKLARSGGKTILFSSHDLHLVLKNADDTWLMTNNEIYQGIPEDLVLNGYFNKLFSSPFLTFDKESGDFKFQMNAKNQVNVVGLKNHVHKWTMNALEREGYLPIEGSGPVEVKILNDNKVTWEISTGDAKYNAQSLQQVIEILEKQVCSNSC